MAQSPTRAVGWGRPRCGLASASMAERLVVIGGNPAGMAAATNARRGRPDLEIVAIERGSYTSYSSCGLPYVVGGAVGSIDELVVRTPKEFRDLHRIDVRLRHEVTAIDLDARRIEIRALDQDRTLHLGFDLLHLATGCPAGAPRPPRHRRSVGARRADHRRHHPAAAGGRGAALPARRGGGQRLHRPGAGRGVRRPRHRGHPGRGRRPTAGVGRPRPRRPGGRRCCRATAWASASGSGSTASRTTRCSPPRGRCRPTSWCWAWAFVRRRSWPGGRAGGRGRRRHRRRPPPAHQRRRASTPPATAPTPTTW